jgi:coenzyme F420-reducing hydrogenase beta subunit
MKGFLISQNKSECYGCGACQNVCPRSCISMVFDSEGFRYPSIDKTKCISCSLCQKVCPASNLPLRNPPQSAYGGYCKSKKTCEESTSGGFFPLLAKRCIQEKGAVFGAAEINPLSIKHVMIDSEDELPKIQKSKYLQSDVGECYKETKTLLTAGKKVIFSGTPCQIAGLLNYLHITGAPTNTLLTAEVVCEGLPTYLFTKKQIEYFQSKKKSQVSYLDWRYKNKNRWDFQTMLFCFSNGKKMTIDRWVNPFWSIWLSHVMSRPSCYDCPFAAKERVADISMGDLWGVHKYCPDLYNKDRGASVVFINTEKGKNALENVLPNFNGRPLNIDDAIRYQGPLRNHIIQNPLRNDFFQDISTFSYPQLVRKYGKKNKVSFLIWKYCFGNRWVVFWSRWRKTRKR